MKKRTAWILVASVAAIAVGAAAVGAVALLVKGQRGTPWAGQNYLYLNLDGDVPEQPLSDIGTFLDRRPLTVRHIVESVDRAATDGHVTALVLRVGFLPEMGWGRVQEIRDAVGRFRKSGKPAYAHLELAGNKEYYLASACDRVFALPTALIHVTGLASEVTFFRKTLDKVGIEAQFEGVGRYKNAPNQFTEAAFTEAHREQMEALIESLHGQFVAGLAKGRGRTVAEVQALIDKGPYDGPTALEAGLVDELLYEDQIEDRFKASGRLLPARYLRSARGLGFDGRPRVAVIYAVGEIMPGESQGTAFGDFAGSDTVGRAIRRARDDRAIRAIVLRVDSPGGVGTASEVIWREVQIARKEKPVVASMGDLAASGGYYVAMGSDAIVAQPATITGSIGVFSGKFTVRGLYDKLGITKELIERGRHAGFFSEYRPWTDEERARLRELMTSFYADFVKKAAEGRKKTYDDIDAVAQGRVWTGEEALRHGLVDRLGGLDAAFEIAKQKARIPASQEIAVVVLPERKGLFESLLERQEEGAPEEMLPRDLRAAWRWARVLGRGGLMARLPFDLRVR